MCVDMVWFNSDQWMIYSEPNRKSRDSFEKVMNEAIFCADAIPYIYRNLK